MNKTLIKEYAIMTFGSLLVAIAIIFFMAPGGLVFGSASGLAMILIEIFPIKLSVMNLILNILFLIMGFIFIGKDFGAKTVYCSLLMSVYLAIFEILFPNFVSFTNDQLLDAIGYIVVVSVGLAVLFNANALLYISIALS